MGRGGCTWHSRSARGDDLGCALVGKDVPGTIAGTGADSRTMVSSEGLNLLGPERHCSDVRRNPPHRARIARKLVGGLVPLGVCFWNVAKGSAEPPELDEMGVDRSAPDGVRTR